MRKTAKAERIMARRLAVEVNPGELEGVASAKRTCHNGNWTYEATGRDCTGEIDEYAV